MIAGVGETSGEKPAAVLEAGDLRAVFTRRGDRFAHRIEVRDAATQAWIVALESHEGNDEEHWPPSPPFQQLHVEHRKEGDVVLLVGMAGRSHWSAAVDVGPDGKTLRFDVAVRVQQSGGRLGSNYEIVDQAATDRLTKTCDQKDTLAGRGSGKVRNLETGEETESFCVGFSPWNQDEVGRPATLCWKYQLGLKPAP